MKFIADENFEGAIFRGLLRRMPDLDIERVQDVGLLSASDADILEWAYQHGRIVLTHDQKTMPRFAYKRMAGGNPFNGMIVMRHTISVGKAIEDILLITTCSTMSEWVNQIQLLPL
jgi:predicted nuclease of predicted toxin-antitoxin system